MQKQTITFFWQETHYTAAYEDVGQGSPILFLHGFMGEGGCWRSLIPYLQPDYRCICLDMMGFGQSSKPAIRYDIATLVGFVRQFAEALHLESLVVVGHSLGGWVGAAYALAVPAQVRGLILIAPAGIRDDSFCGRYDHLRPLLWQTPVVDVALWLMQPIAMLTRQTANLKTIRWMRRELNAQPAARSFLVDRMRPEDAIDTVENDIHHLSMPALVIAGDRDETIPLWHCETYARQIPQSQLVILANADHSLPQHHAAALSETMRPFLATVTALNLLVDF